MGEESTKKGQGPEPAVSTEWLQEFVKVVPHNAALGMRVVSLESGVAIMELPWAPHLVGNPVTEVLHGGAVSSLMDACCGAAVFMALSRPRVIATLDLRIDYLKPATTRETVLAEAHCYRMTRSVAFVRCLAHHGDTERAIASASGSFIIRRRRSS